MCHYGGIKINSALITPLASAVLQNNDRVIVTLQAWTLIFLVTSVISIVLTWIALKSMRLH